MLQSTMLGGLLSSRKKGVFTMFDAVVLSTIGYVLIIISLFGYAVDHSGGGKDSGYHKKGLIMTLLGLVLLLLSVWVH